MARVDGDPNQIPTRDKKYIWVDTYARWRIANPLLFFQRLRDERGAQSRLDDIIDGDTRNVVASHNLIEVVRSQQPQVRTGEDVEDVMEAEAMRQVELGRDKITRLILERASKVMPEYGIELVDVQIQRINYIETVQTKVFERMISERKRIADRHRSEGQGKSAEIRGKKERELKGIESEAYRKTQEIMGKATQRRRRSTPTPTIATPISTGSCARWTRIARPSTRAAGWCCPPTPTSSGTCNPLAGRAWGARASVDVRPRARSLRGAGRASVGVAGRGSGRVSKTREEVSPGPPSGESPRGSRERAPRGDQPGLRDPVRCDAPGRL